MVLTYVAPEADWSYVVRLSFCLDAECGTWQVVQPLLRYSEYDLHFEQQSATTTQDKLISQMARRKNGGSTDEHSTFYEKCVGMRLTEFSSNHLPSLFILYCISQFITCFLQDFRDAPIPKASRK